MLNKLRRHTVYGPEHINRVIYLATLHGSQGCHKLLKVGFVNSYLAFGFYVAKV